MKAVKLGRADIRRIIEEAIQHKPWGEPEPMLEPEVSQIAETNVSQEVQALLFEFASQLGASLRAEHDSSNCSEDDWDKRVNRVVEHVVTEAENALTDAVTKMRTSGR